MPSDEAAGFAVAGNVTFDYSKNLQGGLDTEKNAMRYLLDLRLTVDTRAARETCRLCDAHACGHYEGACPVTRAADRGRAPA